VRIGALIPVLIAAGIVAIIAYVISGITGLPFWGAFVAVAVIGGIGYLLLNPFDFLPRSAFIRRPVRRVRWRAAWSGSAAGRPVAGRVGPGAWPRSRPS
jgi:hypothetical protein